jgi:cobalt-zinc-cadmium efflux system protein
MSTPDSHSHHSHEDDSHADRPHADRYSHGSAPVGERRLLLAFALTAITMCGEAAGGWWSGSLALLADAGHMLVDAFALLVAWAGAHFARRPADTLRSFGYARLEVLVGYTNALVQFGLTAWIVFEAVARLRTPDAIEAKLMFAVATGGALINFFVLRTLGDHAHDDVNAAGAHLHVWGDLLGSLGAVLAALAIWRFGWLWADAGLSIVVALLILRSAWELLRRCAHILLEGVPEGVEPAQVADTVRREALLADVHHVHVWQLAGGRRIATLHARLVEGGNADAALAAIRFVLRERFQIAHATIQIEGSDCVADDCREPASDVHHHADHHHR